MKGLKITLILLFIYSLSQAQHNVRSGYKVGMSYCVGSPIHRLGLQAGFYAATDYAQVQSIGQVFYCFKNYGPEIPRWEAQISAGAQVSFGKSFTQSAYTANLSEISNFTKRKQAIGYSLKYYWDKIGTAQTTGLISLRLGNFFIATENDGLVFKHWDRYRTGGFIMGYDIDRRTAFNFLNSHRVALNLLLYTASSQDENTHKVRDSDYPCRFGYLDMDSAKYAQASHGILSLSWQSNFSQRQNIYAEVGIDNERIRDLVQNKFIHDMPFLPKTWLKTKNPHIPMKSKASDSYLYKDNQEIRPSKFVWGLGINKVLFY